MAVTITTLVDCVRDIAVRVRLSRCVVLWLGSILRLVLRVAPHGHIRMEWLVVLWDEALRCRSESLQVSDHV